ncbi:hypothetical protein NW801_21885 [Brevibacillus laterosporus]|uniref:Type II secretion system protein GspF domain-containing protein n=1 Tax=Brevibacillus halotolerans TaxID=1507437 RepID=A0ABT4I2V7_9BACL|nr:MULTISPECIES: hypothetical protein [Brevibacillus]MCR8987643.1 hypothetical protein [Brevibacillus laterosporus]MCZ0833382.1 hypothetical protein [Brevibacillus halotolerans]
MRDFTYLLLLIVTITGLFSYYFLRKGVENFSSDIQGKRKFRTSIREVIQDRKKQLDRLLENTELEEQFKKAGNPFKLNGLKFQYIRLSILLLIAMPKIVMLAVHPESAADVVTTFILIVFVYLITLPGDYSPLTMLLKYIVQYRDKEKNRELFQLYSLIADEIYSSQERSINLYHLLKEMSQYTKLIRPAIDKALIAWSRDTDAALLIMAKEINTVEADELIKILADLQNSDAQKGVQLLKDRQETFILIRKENKRRKMRSIHQVGIVVAFVPLFAYTWNYLNMALMEVNFLTDFTNNFRP